MKTLLAALMIFSSLGVRAEQELPGEPFPASRYEPLWKSSPFAVATPVAVESAEYSLVGAAQFDGVSYASLIEKQTQNHFVVTSATPAHGLTLVSLMHGGDSTFATLQKDGALLKLKLEAGAATATAPPSFSSPVIMNNPPGFFPSHPPRARFHPRTVTVPLPTP
jgi:hypothetical protein